MATGDKNRPAVPPALPPRIYRNVSGSEIPGSQKNLTKSSTGVPEEIPEAIYEDPDALLNSIPHVSPSEAKPKPVPLPRSRDKQHPQLYDSKNSAKANCMSKTTSENKKNVYNQTYNDNLTNKTKNDNKTRTSNIVNTNNTSRTNCSTNISLETSTNGETGTISITNANPVTSTRNIKTPTLNKVGTINSTYNDDRTNQTNTVNSSDKTAYTELYASSQSRENSNKIPHPVRQPPPPPVPPKRVNSSTIGSPLNDDMLTKSDQSVEKLTSLPHPGSEPTSPLYCDRDNPALHARDNTNRAPPSHQPKNNYNSSVLDLRTLESREKSLSINPKEQHYHSSASSQYTNANPRYIEVLPDLPYDFYQAPASTCVYYEENRSTYGNLYQLSPDDIPELLMWLKKVSRQSGTLTQYGLSEEEEIRSFNQQANHLRKARRLYQLLMMKRKEAMQNVLKEFQAICKKLDKVKKTNKAMGIAGGATGAVGGVTAVVGVALAPVTMGVSLIATAVGAGIAASAGGFGAHAAKANKKIVNRETVEKLVNDYKKDVVDLEHCLNYILCMMMELRRHNIFRLQKAGAHPDTLRMVDLSQAVFNSNVYRSRPMSPTSPGGMPSESLLKHFADEFDHYFTEKKGQKLKKSNKSKFSGRVCILVKNLQEELNYLIQMWEALT